MRRQNRVRILALGLILSTATGSAVADGPEFVCPPVSGPVTIDGNLAEWDLGHKIEIRDEFHLVLKDPNYAGPSDLSAIIYVARSATTLYFAGEVRDDTLFWNPRKSWLGDGVELFLDFHPDRGTREPNGVYDEYAHQLLLHPLASEVRWNFVRFKGRPGRMDTAVDGLVLGALDLMDAKGARVGYTFELALPLANFPAAPTEEGAVFGFDVALSDSDGRPEQKNYATWSGRSRLSEFPARFGRMRLGAPPPPVEAPEKRSFSHIGPLVFLVAVLGALLFLWLGRALTPGGRRLRGFLYTLRRIRLRPKLVAGAVILLLIVLAGLVGRWVEAALTAADINAKRQVASDVRKIAQEAARERLLEPRPPGRTAPLISLIAGQSVRPPVEYDFKVLPPVDEPPHRTRAGVPFLRRDLPALTAWAGDFVVFPPVAAHAATLVYSFRAEPSAEDSPKPGDEVARFRFVHRDGSVDEIEPLLWNRHVIEHDRYLDPDTPDQGGPSEATVAFIKTGEVDGVPVAEHGLELRVLLPETGSTSPITRIHVEQTLAGGRFFLHGVTLHPRNGSAPVPLPLARPSRSAIPTWASPFPGKTDGLQLHARNPRETLLSDGARADRVWIVASLRRGYAPHRYRQPVLLVDMVFDDGSVDGTFRLENGVHLDPEAAPTRRRDEAFQSELAFEWGLPGDRLLHFDLATLPLTRPGRTLREIQFEFVGEDEVVRISSVTLGSQLPAVKQHEVEILETGADGYRISEADRERLRNIHFTLYRDGRAVETTAPGDIRDRMLARTISAEEARAIAEEPQGVHALRLVEDQELHTLVVPAPGGRFNEILELSWTGEATGETQAWVTGVRVGLAALLAPLLVLIVADMVLRIPSLHVRLVAGFAAAAAVPVALGFVAVPELLGSKIEADQRDAAERKLSAVKARLSALRPLARRRAEAAFRDEALQEALKQRGTEGFRTAVSAALRDVRRNLALESTDARVALEVAPNSSAGETPYVFPEEARWTIFAGPTPEISDELAYRWSRLAASGVAKRPDPTDATWEHTLVVELPLDRAALQDAAAGAGGKVEVLLYTTRGYPLVATLDAVGEDTAPEMEHKKVILKRVLADKAPFTEVRMMSGSLYTVTYDLLRGQAEIVSLVATAVPRSGAQDLLDRVGDVSLLVFGAGVLMQFLLAGVVLASTSRPFNLVLERARAAAGAAADRPEDEIRQLDGALDAVDRDRRTYRTELGRLHEAVTRLARARNPDEVVEHALAIVERAVGPWGALLVAPAERGGAELLGGFRGDDRLGPAATSISSRGPLSAVLGGVEEAHLHSLHEIVTHLTHAEQSLVQGAESVEAYPLAEEGGSGGMLLILHRARPGVKRTTYHAEFVAALARHVGFALASSRLVRLAVRDPATGMYVASFFEQRTKEEVDRAVAAKRPIALVLVHASDLPRDPAGMNRRMRELAEVVRQLAPGRGFVGRPEDDLLAVTIPEADRASAEALARELRRALTEPRFERLRAKVGVATCPEDAGSYEFLVAEARSGLAGPEGPRTDTGVAVDQGSVLRAEARRLGTVFESAKGLQILETVDRIAGSDITILVEGETGAGKEVVADLIHRKSRRRAGALVKVNCAALPDALLESELFGFERGAFTGADRTKPGRFELADGGTLFLDEIGEMSLATQVKLLRVLEDRAVEHLGGTRPIPVDVRVIAATNCNLRARIAEGLFREDLYYRLNAVTIAVPPLRARKDDIPALVETFVRRAAEAHGCPPPRVTPDAMDLLFRHDWPGNARELRNAMEQAVVLATGPVIDAKDLRPALRRDTHTQWAPPPRTTGDRASSTRAPQASPAGISDRQRRLLAILGEREWITNAEYCRMVGVSTRTGLRDFKELIGRGVLTMDGKRRGARYRLS